MIRANQSWSATNKRLGRSTAAFVSVVVMVLALSSCGVESGGDAVATNGNDNASTTTTEDPGGDESTTTEDDGGDDTTTTADETTTTEDSGADTTTTTAAGGPDVPGGTDVMIRDALIQSFQSSGFTAEQATCLADGFIDLGLTDPSASGEFDPMAMMDLFSQCGISLEDLGKIGAGMGG